MNKSKDNLDLSEIIGWYKGKMLSILRKSQKRPYLIGTVDTLESDLLSIIVEEINGKLSKIKSQDLKILNRLANTLAKTATIQVHEMISEVRSNLDFYKLKSEEVSSKRHFDKTFFWIKSHLKAQMNLSLARSRS